MAGTWPWPKGRYCWGAWEEDSGPEILGDAAFGEDGGSRSGEETAPTRERPVGSCELTIAGGHKRAFGTEVPADQRVTVEYGPVPEAAKTRLSRLQSDYLRADMAALPDGLPGTVGGGGGLVVLPKSCDTRDGRPTVVTMEASGTLSDGSGAGADLGGTSEVAVLLVAAANRGMEAAGCAPDEPLRADSPVYDQPSESKRHFAASEDLCGIRGLRLDEEKVEESTGAVTRDLHTCSLSGERGHASYLNLAMVAQPRLAAMFDGIVGERPVARGWRGTGSVRGTHAIVRADCAGRPATFLMDSSTDLGHLATFSNAVADRLGCAPIAPEGAAR
ncbi:hypothetical protein [Streptomyces xiaopingdaonensis]|uniref:hypothetical protein n=1 Tax=Streptomyces xiaopingdaonensis TaxID=1565415 RepID=UPI00030509C9|nr:hypothetical protein [Streptomyces xiaopingdaonensis]